MTTTDTRLPQTASTATVIPLAAEELSIGKRTVENARVRVRTLVDHVEQPVSATLTAEHVEVERVSVGRVVSVAPPVREVDGVTIIPVLEERLTVLRELVLVEEVRLRRVRSDTEVNEVVTRRVMRAVVDREDTPPA